MRSLSGGERARLMLALAAIDAPNLLILDEPTNHLDIDARGELVRALGEFSGAVVLVSHDRQLLEGTADRLYLVTDGTVKPFDGDLDDYRKFLLAPEAAEAETRETSKQSKEAARRAAAERRRALKPLKDKADALERRMNRLHVDIVKLDAELATPGLFAADAAKAAALGKRRANAAKALAATEEAWLAAQETYEKARDA